MQSIKFTLAILVLLASSISRADTAPPVPAAAPTTTSVGGVYPPVPAGETPPGGSLPPGTSILGLPGEGFTISSQDGRYSLNLRARFQVRDTGVDIENAWTNQIGIKTLRLIFSGHLLSPEIGYFIQLAEGGGDFDTKLEASGTTTTPNASFASPIYDAFIEFTHFRDLSLRVGQFYVPFDRARTIRDYALQFVDRQQMVNELSLDRDVGVRLFSDDLLGTNGLFGYSLGVFSGKGKNRVGQLTPGLLYMVRLQIKPFGLFDDDVEGDLTRLHRPRLALGGAVAYNDHTDRAQSTFGTVFTVGTLSYLHADADLVFKYSGFSFLGEYLYRQATTNDIVETPATKTAKAVLEWARDARGYTLQSGFMLTNELEVVGRFDQLLAVGKTDPTLKTLATQAGCEAGGGVNLYLNAHQLKIQTDYFRYFGPSPGLVDNQIRLQLDVTI